MRIGTKFAESLEFLLASIPPGKNIGRSLQVNVEHPSAISAADRVNLRRDSHSVDNNNCVGRKALDLPGKGLAYPGAVRSAVQRFAVTLQSAAL